MTTADRPRADAGAVTDSAPPDPRSVIDDLRRRLRAEQEKSLNARDEVLGARAAAAQAKAETQELWYRLHVRETELAKLKELLDERDAEDGAGQPTTADQTPAEAARGLVAAVRRAVGS